MIELLTLFLGLFTGPQPVAASVPDGTAALEIRLDGERVDRQDGPPWVGKVDLGEDLGPYRLEVVAIDDGGDVLARTARPLNLPAEPVRLAVSVEEGAGGGAELQVAGGSAVGTPREVHLFAAGRPLRDLGSGRYLLGEGGSGPPGTTTAGRPLVVQLVHPGNVVERGRFFLRGDRTVRPAAVTAVAVLPAPGARPPRSVAGLEEAFLRDGAPVPPLAVLGGEGGDLVFVVHPAARPVLRNLVRSASVERALQAGAGGRTGEGDPTAIRLSRHDRVYLLSPENVQAATAAERDLFANSPFYPLDRGGIRDTGFSWYLPRLGPEATPPRTADAVAVAGLLAASADRPRAVVLVTAAGEDGSALRPEVVRRYLDDLHVPLRVWVPGGEGATAVAADWGAATALPTWGDLEFQVSLLRDLLAAQRVVWLAGEHPPGELTAAPGAAVRSVRGGTP